MESRRINVEEFLTPEQKEQLIDRSEKKNSKPPRKKKNIAVPILLTLIIATIGVIALQMKSEPENLKPTAIEKEKENPNKMIPFEEVYLGEFNETVFDGAKKGFDVFYSDNEKRTQHYGFYTDDQQTELIIIPQSTQYQVKVEQVVLTPQKEIHVQYSYGNAKIPRISGHIKKFDAQAFTINTRGMDSGKYQLKMTNTDGKVTQEEELDFQQPFYRTDWVTTNLEWGGNGELVYVANKDAKWDIYSYNFGEEDSKKIVDRHADDEENTLMTLGYKNINIPKPVLNKKTGKLLYHGSHDIYEVDAKSGSSQVLTRGIDQPIGDGMYNFDHFPQTSESGEYIYYIKTFAPSTSELWRMYYNGKHQEKMKLPSDGNVLEFKVSPDGNYIAVVMSTGRSTLMAGKDELWVLDISKNEYKRIPITGVSIQDLDFTPDSKSIIYSQMMEDDLSPLYRDIWRSDVDWHKYTRITPVDESMDVMPTISPDGESIAYLSSDDGKHFNLWVMDVDGENRFRVDARLQVFGKPLWSKDSKEIFFTDVNGNVYNFNLYSKNVSKVK